MKKLFLLLYVAFSSLLYSANVYFDYPLNGSTYYSGSSGTAGVNYHIHTVSLYFGIDWYGARIQYPNGSWSSWQDGQSGGWALTTAGTYLIEGKVHVYYDAGGGSNYYMTSDQIYFYVYDNYAPTSPQNLSVSQGSNNNPRLDWSANSESDLSYYEIWRKVHETGDIWQSIGTTSNTYYVDEDYYYAPGAGNFGLTYRVRAKDVNNNYSSYSSEVSTRGEEIGKKSVIANSQFDFVLQQNYPNPFNPTTKVSYSIKEEGLVTLKVYDVLGNEVAVLVNEEKEAGVHSIVFDSGKLASGIYIYKIRFKNKVESKRMILMK